jgi:HAD superfamily hydrolase (TIGR01549 family)
MPDVPVRRDEIRAVVFDVDGTLYRQGPVRRTMVVRLARAHWRQPRSGLRVTRTLSAYRRAQESLRSTPYDGDLAAAQVQLAAQQSGVDATTVHACIDEWMETAPLDVVAASARAGLVEALEAMAASGLKLGVVSDYPAHRKLHALGIADRFDAIVSAQDERVQAFKPDPRGIRVALQDLGVAPAHALYVGDREDVDVPAAAAADIGCVLVGPSRRRTPDHGFVRVNDFGQLVDLLRRG